MKNDVVPQSGRKSEQDNLSGTTATLNPKYLHRGVLALYHTGGPKKHLIFGLNTSQKPKCIIFTLQTEITRTQTDRSKLTEILQQSWDLNPLPVQGLIY